MSPIVSGMSVSLIERDPRPPTPRELEPRAVAALPVSPDVFLVDGKWNFVGERARMVVRGDCESVSIAAASIVVKVARDALMSSLAGLYPHYAFEANKGYPAPRHLWGLSAYGPSPIHRRLYAPIRKLLDEGVPGRLLPERSVCNGSG